MRYLMALMVVVGISFAFTPNSFRLQSTAYLFEDDYDLIFDPARLPLIEGSRLYTNLSNLVSSDEDVFGTATANYYLFAGSTKLGKLYPGFIYDNYTMKDPVSTGLVGRLGDTLYGEGQTEFIDWRDLDNNGAFDFKSVDSRKAHAWSEQYDTDFLFAIGTKMGENKRVGFSYTHLNSGFKYTYPVWNHLYDRKDSNLISGLYTSTYYDSAEGLTKTTYTSHDFHLSGWLDSDQWSAGISLKFIPASYTIDVGNYDSIYDNRSPANPAIVDYMMRTVSDTSMMPYSGFTIPTTLKLFYNWNDKTQSRVYLTYSMGRSGLSDNAGGLTITKVDSTCRPGKMLVNDTVTHTYFGDRNDDDISLMTQHFFKVSDRFDLAFGLGFSNESFTDELNDSLISYQYRSFNDGDTLADRDDTTFVTTRTEWWLTKTTGVYRTVYLPVGLEFKIFNPLKLRLGAQHTVSFRDETKVDDLKEFLPAKTKVTLGDGTSYETMAPQTRKPSTSTDKPTIHETEYYYGLGWNATDNLQFDLMHFAELTDLTEWKLSVTFKF